MEPGPSRNPAYVEFTRNPAYVFAGSASRNPAYFTASEKTRLRLFTSNAPFAGTTVA